MATVEISAEAQEDFLDVYSALYDESPAYTDFWEKEFFKKVQFLETFPNMGRVVPEIGSLRNFREIFVGKYRVLYVVSKSIVVIVGIRHSAKSLSF
jgi:toxin ParE1/3/4